MRRRGAFATLGLVLMLVATQGCATGAFNDFLEQLFIAAGRIPPPGPIPCGEQSIFVPPGACASIVNACREDQEFIPGDSFAFDDPPEWLTVQRSDALVKVCAASSAPPVVDTPFPYTYADQRSSHGELRVSTVGIPVQAIASATPGRITVGGSTQLNVMVNGGAPPYRFAWRQSEPSDSVSLLGDATLQNPTATVVRPPSMGVVRFQVTVTDAAGQTKTADIGVGVDGLPLRVTTTATPSTINRGASSQLLAVVDGGIPPYVFRWSPIFDLDDFLFNPAPIATPPGTVTYTVTVESADGQTVMSSVTITVVQPPATGADLTVSVTDSPDPVLFNQSLTYTITLRNNGPTAATLVSLSVMAPAQAEAGPVQPSQGTCTRTSNNFTCAIGTMASGATVTATISMFPFATGPISLTATATASEADPNPANNSATQQTTVLGL
jgi:uncharacterized repeat protein (TIGR01451 family)